MIVVKSGELWKQRQPESVGCRFESYRGQTPFHLCWSNSSSRLHSPNPAKPKIKSDAFCHFWRIGSRPQPSVGE